MFLGKKNVLWKFLSVIVGPVDYTTKVLQLSPLAYYRLSDTTSTATDEMGYANGVHYGSIDAPGLIVGDADTARYYDATDYTEIPGASNLSFTNGVNDLPFSISAIFSVDDLLTPHPILFKGYTKPEYILQTNADGEIRFAIYSNNSYLDKFQVYTNIGFVVPGVKYFVVATYDGSHSVNGMELYVNGVNVVTTRLTDPYVGMTSVEPATIGSSFLTDPTFEQHFKGTLDEIAVFDRVLTPTEVADLYNAGIPVNFLYTLDNPNADGSSADDRFGFTVATSTSYVLVGAHFETESGGTITESGKVYVFDKTTGALLHTINNPNAYSTSAGDRFGNSISMTDTYTVIAAYFEDDASGGNSGKVYVYQTSTWTLLRTIDNPNPVGLSGNDYFGRNIAVTDNYILVGAYLEDESTNLNTGKAYIFDPSTGNLLHTFDDPNAYGTSANDYFSYLGTAITNNYVAISAFSEDDAAGTDSGKVYIYDTATWSLVHTLDNPNPYGSSLNDYFGRSVAITDTYILVGANQEDELGNTDSGKAYIFDMANGGLLHTLDNPNAYGTSAGDTFGEVVALTDTYAVVSAPLEDDLGGLDSGKVYIFDPTSGSLMQIIDNPNAYGTSDTDRFGISLAASNTHLVVGAWPEDDAGGLTSGKAYVYSLP